MKKVIILTALSLVSGIVSTPYFGFYSKDALVYAPGTIFGIAGAIFAVTFADRWWKYVTALLWIVASTVSYYAAFFTTVRTVPSPLIAHSFVLPFLYGGAVGGVLVAVSWALCIKRLKFSFIIFLTTLSALLAVIPAFIPETSRFNFGHVLFILWQTGMGLALGFAMKRSQQPVNTLAQV